jgi:hypothetical protein
VQRLRLALLVLSLAVAPCGRGEDDLPPGWEEARRVMVDQSACEGDGIAANGGSLVLMRDMARLRASYEKAPFRCQQRVCAHRRDEGGVTQVLVQPCDMDPDMVVRCDCLYRVSFELPDVAAGGMVELYRRWDRYGATEEPLPALVDRERAP